jgi:Sulfotransferase domain
MTLPDLYLVGAPKAGTTTVARWLSGHPDVYWSVPKEPYYWASDYPRMRAHYGFDDRAAYEDLYSSDEASRARYRGDGSTTYLYSRSAVPDIDAAVPDARFLVCVRNPIDLVVSYHRTQLVALNEDEPDFAKAWSRHRDGGLPDTDPLDDKLLDYTMVGCVGAAVERLLRIVPRERVHVIVFDDLAQDPVRTWDALAAFVDVDASIVPSFRRDNPSDKAPRWPTLRRLTHRPPPALEPGVRRLRQWSRTTSTPGVAALKRRMWRPESRPVAAVRERQELAEFFKADVELLSELLGRELAWTTATANGS